MVILRFGLLLALLNTFSWCYGFDNMILVNSTIQLPNATSNPQSTNLQTNDTSHGYQLEYLHLFDINVNYGYLLGCSYFSEDSSYDLYQTPQDKQSYSSVASGALVGGGVWYKTDKEVLIYGGGYYGAGAISLQKQGTDAHKINNVYISEFDINISGDLYKEEKSFSLGINLGGAITTYHNIGSFNYSNHNFTSKDFDSGIKLIVGITLSF